MRSKRKSNPRPKAYRWFSAILALLVATVCLFGQTKSQGKALGQGKLDAALDYLNVSMLSPGDKISVIIQFQDDGKLHKKNAKDKGKKKQDRRNEIASEGGLAEKEYDNLPMVTTRVTYAQLKNLAKHPGVRRISVNHLIKGSTFTTARAIGADQVWAGSATMPSFTGNGVGVAVIDSGTLTSGDLNGKVVYSSSYIGSDTDEWGHGTHVASTIVGTGENSEPGTGFPVQYKGIAPGAHVISLRVLGADGSGLAGNVIAALDWCITNKSLYNIRVINLSLGQPVFESYTTDPFCQAVERAVRCRDRRRGSLRQPRETAGRH